ncbi:MAG: class I SAM-dependent methyltransferase [Dysgonamonadaceae bacterium]|jgi:SAM-dependent methyltransferase|nr:class I SAM-dependent methyltransferase [Dysgonamonadaceae bacterium]
MDMTNYFSGENLYGDNYTIEEIIQWYKEEEEAYADMYGKDVSDNTYSHHLDILFGYKYIPVREHNIYNALGFGSSWGYELLPVINRIENIHIIDSSDQTVSKKLGNKVPKYIKATVSGKIDIPDETFDLITCFSVLHHIPNVTFVVSELFRVLQKGGYLLLREPINSMGDWRNNREGLTKHERGIPPQYLKNIILSHKCEIIKLTYHHFIYSFLNRKLHSPKFLDSKWYLKFDRILSELFIWNFHYHPKNYLQRIAPGCAYYVIRKP